MRIMSNGPDSGSPKDSLHAAMFWGSDQLSAWGLLAALIRAEQNFCTCSMRMGSEELMVDAENPWLTIRRLRPCMSLSIQLCVLKTAGK